MGPQEAFLFAQKARGLTEADALKAWPAYAAMNKLPP